MQYFNTLNTVFYDTNISSGEHANVALMFSLGELICERPLNFQGLSFYSFVHYGKVEANKLVLLLRNVIH